MTLQGVPANMAAQLQTLQANLLSAQTLLDNWNKEYYNQKAIYQGAPSGSSGNGTRAQASQNMASAQSKISGYSAVRDAAYKAVGDYQTQINQVIAQNIASLQSDPSFKLSQIKADAEAQATTTAANASAAATVAAANSKRTVYIIVGVALGLAFVASIFIYVMNKEKAAFKSDAN